MCDGGGASGAFCGKCNDGNKLCRALTPDDTCTDLVQNNLETDLDCGGEECQNANAAYLCAMVKGCSDDADCASAQCRGAVCTSCSNSLLDGGETAADCGGADCEGCLSGSACFVAADCASKQCEGGVCTSCKNGAADGYESDVDCGGATCGSSGVVGQKCVGNADCATGKCNIALAQPLCEALTPFDTCRGGGFAGNKD